MKISEATPRTGFVSRLTDNFVTQTVSAAAKRIAALFNALFNSLTGKNSKPVEDQKPVAHKPFTLTAALLCPPAAPAPAIAATAPTTEPAPVKGVQAAAVIVATAPTTKPAPADKPTFLDHVTNKAKEQERANHQQPSQKKTKKKGTPLVPLYTVHRSTPNNRK